MPSQYLLHYIRDLPGQSDSDRYRCGSVLHRLSLIFSVDSSDIQEKKPYRESPEERVADAEIDRSHS